MMQNLEDLKKKFKIILNNYQFFKHQTFIYYQRNEKLIYTYTFKLKLYLLN